MGVELRPLGVRCNIGCQYCYQNMHRDAGNFGGNYDMEIMKAAILEHGGPFHLFGGEPLLVEASDLEELFRWGLEQFGENAIQTNGVLLDDNHLRMFEQYQVRVGVSIDGPGALNDVRWAGSQQATRAATQKTERALERLCASGIVPNLMVQLTRCNCSPRRLPRMLKWIREMDELGIRSARLHILEIENNAVREKYGLSVEENIAVLSKFMELEKELENLSFDLATDMKNMLLARDLEATCVWRACDPYTTESVHGLDGQGEPHNCGLTDKEGINFQKPAEAGYERYIALYHTPQEYGGCQGCRFFLACKGQCPGTALDRDWRNKTEYCGVWKKLFKDMERDLLNEGLRPISTHPLRAHWEQQMLERWAAGDNMIQQMDFSSRV